MTIGDFSIHPKFKLNGLSYTGDQLKELSYDLVKEGIPFEKSIGNFFSDWLDEKTFLEVMTSGSTGLPKTIRLHKSQMINSARATGKYFDLSAGNLTLLCLSADYIAGKMMLVRAFVLGLEIDYIVPNSNPLKGVTKSFDFAAMVPLQLQNSLSQIEQVKKLIVGGAAMPASLKDQIQDLETEIFETYGMTETITHVAVKRTNGPTKRDHFHALSNVTFQTDDRECLVIDAPGVASETVQTNDIVQLISKTEFEWLGRYDNVINSGGVKLIPEQIEKKLEAHISNRFFVCGIPDEKLGEKLVLLVEGDIDKKKLIEQMRATKAFSKYEYPKAIYLQSNFKYTETGKINRLKTVEQAKLKN